MQIQSSSQSNKKKPIKNAAVRWFKRKTTSQRENKNNMKEYFPRMYINVVYIQVHVCVVYTTKIILWKS